MQQFGPIETLLPIVILFLVTIEKFLFIETLLPISKRPSS